MTPVYFNFQPAKFVYRNCKLKSNDHPSHSSQQKMVDNIEDVVVQQHRGPGRPRKYATKEEQLEVRRQQQRENNLKYYYSHKDQVTSHNRDYYQTHREEVLAKQRNYRANHSTRVSLPETAGDG